MKKNLLVLIAVFLCTYTYGQGEIDALRFSKDDLTGTARGQAMGGAFGALGGDITGVLINPAGIGIYRSSEISGTLGFNSVSTKTNWNNQFPETGDKTRFNLDNISYVGYFPLGDENIQNINFGFTYNKLKNFNRKYSTRGTGMPNSLSDYVADITSGKNIHFERDLESDYPYDGKASWLSVLGYSGYLINPFGDGTEYGSYFPDGFISPQLGVSEKGYINSYDFTLGTNVSNSVYLGLSFSFTDIYYRMDALYREDFENKENFVLDNYLETEGSGYQLNIGAIWRPVDFLRLGIAYHSPTWYVMKDYYQGEITPSYESRNDCQLTPDHAFTDYNFRSPYSWVFSAAGILGTQAIVSIDYEIKNYQAMNLEGSDGIPYRDSNQFIDDDFKTTSTLRAGFEYRFTPQFAGRVGYSWAESPYTKEFKNDRPQEAEVVGTIPHYVLDGNISHYTAGIGYKFTPKFYLDMAFVYRTQTDDVYFFPSIFKENGKRSPDAASLKNTSYKGLVTLGYKF